MSDSQANSPDLQEQILACLQQLIKLGHKKQAVLLERRHSDLPPIVEEEKQFLAQLEELKAAHREVAGAQGAEMPGNPRNPRALAQMAASVVELQRINGVNASLVQEHLSSVEMCLSLLDKALTGSYEALGKEHSNGNGKALRGVLNLQA